jgi:hypothetical protein
MAVTLIKSIDKEFQGKSAKELLDAPVSALSGISEEGGKVLAERFGIKTIGDLANWKLASVARALHDIAKAEE